VSERACPDVLTVTLVEALRPLVAELVAEEVERALAGRSPRADEEPPYSTVAQYAERHQTTPAAVRARIRRGKQEAIKPPGAREWLIPTGGGQQRSGKAGTIDPTAKSPRDAATSGGVTPKG
jgi:hypothetical protein